MAAKVTFDTAHRIIKFKPGVTSIDFQADIYSAGKQDWMDDANLNRFIFPVISIGGNVVTGGKVIEPTFFLRNGWQMEPDSANHVCTVFGNIFHLENLPLMVFPAGYAIAVNMSTTISPEPANPLTAAAVADQVWDEQISEHADTGSAGELAQITERKVDDNQALIISR